MLALLLAVSAIALHHFSALTVSAHDLLNQQARISFLAQRANQHTQNAAMHLLRLLQTSDREQRVVLYRAMDAALADSDAAIGGLERADLMDSDGAQIRQLVELRARYGESFQETVERIEIEGLNAARQHFDVQTDVLLKSLLASTLAIAERQQERMQAKVEYIEAAAASAGLIVWGIALSALLVGLALALLIARSITRPVQQAVDAAESIASGNYAFVVPPGEGKEIGVLMSALETMRERIATRELYIRRLAYLDVLTDLPNRNRFLDDLRQSLASGSGGIVLLDLNRFAAINNALGHAVGDRILVEIAQRLRQVIPEQFLLARLGSDKFAILLRQADKGAIVAFAQHLLMQLHKPVSIDGQHLDVDASLGIVLFPQDGDSITTLMRRADLAVALAKRRHDGFVFGADVAHEPAPEQLALMGEMRDALRHEEFVAYFQPKQALSSGQIVGAEALLRWRHPKKGLIAPARFIPFAEQTGFIREITVWLLHHVVQQAAVWHRAGLDLIVSINLSTLDLARPTLVQEVRRLLEENALPPRWICLEITESALMDDPEQALHHLAQLAALGVKLSIDDYGSGQASLAYVQQLPVHELKIDRAFVDKVDRQLKNAAIVRSTILLCRELGLSVVAEGAQTPEEIDWLRRNGCDIVQGYGIAKPMPAESVADWVRERHLAF